MKLYAGIDLHSSNNYISIINEEDQRLFQKRLPNNLESILPALEPFKESLEGVVVESTFSSFVNTVRKSITPSQLLNPASYRCSARSRIQGTSGQSRCHQAV